MRDVLGVTTTHYLTPGYDAGVAPTTIINMAVPRAGTLQKFYIHHNTANGNGNGVTYTVIKNGVATAITVTLASGAIGTGSDTVNTVAVVAGDLIAIQVTKALSITNGNLDVTATLEVV